MMDESTVTTLLAEQAEQVDVGQPPIEAARQQGEHIRRRRSILAASGGAAAVVVLVAVAAVIVQPGDDAGSAPATHDGQGFGQTVLTPEMLDLRGRELAEALGLREIEASDSQLAMGGSGVDFMGGCSNEPESAFVEYVDGHGYCVALGNAPDNWLAALLVWDQWNPGQRLLEQAGVAWTAELPPPPPVVIGLLSQNLASVEAQYGQQSLQYVEAQRALDTASGEWNQRGAWEAAGWNERYWGDPWWPTTALNADEDPLAPVQELTGKAVGDALGLAPRAIEVEMNCHTYAQYDGVMGFCLDTLDVSQTERRLIGFQILGYPRTPTLVEYVDLELEHRQLMRLPDEDKDWPTILAQSDRLMELRRQMEAEHIGG